MTNEMTAEEAVKILRFEQEQVEHRLDGCSDTQENRNIYEAFRMAIKALQPKPMEKFDDVKTHIQRLAGDYKCWDNRLTWEEAMELNRMLESQPNSNEFFNFDAPMVKKSDAVSRMSREEKVEVNKILRYAKSVNMKAYKTLIRLINQPEERDCKTCIHSLEGGIAPTEECHECMWKSRYANTNINEWVRAGEINGR